MSEKEFTPINAMKFLRNLGYEIEGPMPNKKLNKENAIALLKDLGFKVKKPDFEEYLYLIKNPPSYGSVISVRKCAVAKSNNKRDWPKGTEIARIKFTDIEWSDITSKTNRAGDITWEPKDK